MNAPGRKTPEVASTTVAVELGEYEALKRERAILREIRRVAPLSYFMFDLEGGLRLQSDNLERLTGWTLEHVRTRHVAELVADGDMAGLMAAAQAAMRRPGEPVAFRYSMRCRDEGWIAVESAIVSLLDDPDIGGILGIGRVVDREQQLEGENAELKTRLGRVEQLDVIGTLASGIAHDFNNVLQAVLGNAQLGLEDVPEGSPAAEFFQEIVKAGSLAQRLVAKLLTYARQRTPQQQVVDLSRCVQDALSLLRLGLPPEVRLAAEVAEDVGQIWDEPTNVHQLILNLGTNAIAAVADRGQVRVSLQLWESKSARPARFGQICVGQYARLSVSDDGEGMSAEVQARIFQPFFTTREAGHGTGLGLAVVAEIVRTQHGAIDVRSTLGEGTSIEVYLPLLSGQEAAMRRVDDVRPEGTEAIAVIDDDPGVLLVAKSFLDRLGYRTTHYSSARPFLQDLETRSQSFDVVVTDLSMPGFSGIALAQHLAQNHPSLPVILTSGFDEPLQTVGSAPPTVRAILRKPYGAVDIGRVIRRVLKQTARG